MTYKKKLIEVALPLTSINDNAAREKEPFTRNHPRSLHVWWARRPNAAARALLFAQLVDDPASRPDLFPTEELQQVERTRLLHMVAQLSDWDNTFDSSLMADALAEIEASCDGRLPSVLDPFAGGGAIPIEAQRLGLVPLAGDLNPVASLINRALIELPASVLSRQSALFDEGLLPRDGLEAAAADVKALGARALELARDEIGHLYPRHDNEVPLAWIWARTVPCLNPACALDIPLIRSCWLSKRNRVHVEIDASPHVQQVSFRIAEGGEARTGTVDRSGATCPGCGEKAPLSDVRKLAKAGKMGQQLMAIVKPGVRGKRYVAPDDTHDRAGRCEPPEQTVSTPLPGAALGFRVQAYGMTTHASLFTGRQQHVLASLAKGIERAVSEGLSKAAMQGEEADQVQAYIDAVRVYASLGLSRWIDLSNSICSWNYTNENVRALFARQAVPMAWDFVEVNPFGDLASPVSFMRKSADLIPTLPAMPRGMARQVDARNSHSWLQDGSDVVICTDPPYYDNIGYADLSDVFYVWLRQFVGDAANDLTSTLLTPKNDELIATPFRHSGRAKADSYFEKGFHSVFESLRSIHCPSWPLVVYYAFKQRELQDEGIFSTGWETMLEGLVSAGYRLVGTWPVRTERASRSVALGNNALASSVVLVCRHKEEGSPIGTRKDFLTRLKAELPNALKLLQQGNVAPVDLAQAAIGPGMAAFTHYATVVEADGSPMRIRAALALTNQVLDEALSEQESDFDIDTRWALAWFEQHGAQAGLYGTAETLARAKNTAVEAVVQAGILSSQGGRVRLLTRDELPEAWSPSSDQRVPVWEVTQHLIRRLEKGGEESAAVLASLAGGLGESAKELAYRLYSICDQNGWAEEATAYNSLVVAWPQITRLAEDLRGEPAAAQSTFDI